jgi:hypothetical protein
MLLNSYTTGGTSGAGITYPSGAPGFTHTVCSGVRVPQSSFLCIILFIMGFCPFWPVYCLSFFDLHF